MAIKYYCDRDGCGNQTSDSKIFRTFIGEDKQRYSVELLVKNPEGLFGCICVKCASEILLEK